jgi:hypothetical protein
LAQTPGNENIDISAEPIANTEFPLTWRYGTENLPGFLTLYAEGDLWINASITDAFANTSLPNTDSRNVFHDTLQSGLSWSYQLIAKGGVKLANAYYPLDEYGEPAFDPSQVMVRQGIFLFNRARILRLYLMRKIQKLLQRFIPQERQRFTQKINFWQAIFPVFPL